MQIISCSRFDLLQGGHRLLQHYLRAIGKYILPPNRPHRLFHIIGSTLDTREFIGGGPQNFQFTGNLYQGLAGFLFGHVAPPFPIKPGY
jgi:hypothetical protein